MANLSPQQEAFARGVASGLNQSDALRSAYPTSQTWQQKTVHETGSKLMADPKVSARVQELRRPAIEVVELSAKAHVARLAQIRDSALRAGDHGPAVRAEVAIGQVAGHYIQKVEVNKTMFTSMTAEQKQELEILLMDEIERRKPIDLLTSQSVDDAVVKSNTSG
jgi:hypothetical protein